MDGEIHAGDVVVSRVNGTADLYVIATVLSAAGDLDLHGVRAMRGQEAAISCAHGQRSSDRDVWLFGGSAAAYVKAPPSGVRPHVVSSVDEA
jgi:hypothetical protein